MTILTQNTTDIPIIELLEKLGEGASLTSVISASTVYNREIGGKEKLKTG